jgi:release factor glutamine methyltransferase
MRTVRALLEAASRSLLTSDRWATRSGNTRRDRTALQPDAAARSGNCASKARAPGLDSGARADGRDNFRPHGDGPDHPLNAFSVLESERRNEARSETELLLMHALHVNRAWLFAHGDDEIDQAAAERFRALVERRAIGEPLAYLIGHREFFSLDLQVTPDVLIPRPETELLVELALARIPQSINMDIADLGTGSGAVALALAHERPQVRVLATDASSAALDVARKNALRLKIGNVEFAQGNWCAPLDGRKFSLIVSNPPYIAAGDRHLDHGDLRFEPAAALASGSAGLDAIRAIVQSVPEHLQSAGWLLLEHGHDQGAAVRAILQARGFAGIETARDLEGRDRVSSARYDVR